MTFLQCINCDKKKGECKCKNPQFISFLDKKDHKSIEKKLEKEEKKKEVKKVKGRINKDIFVESIILDGKPVFLCNVKDKIQVAEKLPFENGINRPLDENEYGYMPYCFDKFNLNLILNNLPTKQELFEKCKRLIDHYIDICERDKHLILGDLFVSYQQDKIDTLHFPFFVGETESGKSSVLHLFKWLSYRFLLSEDLPNADVYNFLGTDEEATGTIGEDEAQELTKNREKIRTYKNSYSRGSVKPRIINTDSSNKRQIFYKTFGLKLFAGEKVPEDKGFKERLAIIHMTEGLPKGNIKRLNAEEKQTFLSLRNQLLIWKIKTINEKLPSINSGLEKRDQELWEDFQAITSDTTFYQQCKNVVKYYTQQRHQVIWNSIESRLFKLIIQRFKERTTINLEEFWQYLTSEENLQEELLGRLDKQTFYPHDFGIKVTRNYLASLFEDKFQAKRETKYIVEGKKKHKLTTYVFDLEVVRKLSQKYNIMPVILSGGSGGSGKLIDAYDNHVDHLKQLDKK